MDSKVEKIWRIVPDDGLPVRLYPVGQHPENCPIKDGYIVLEYSHNPFVAQEMPHIPRIHPRYRGVYDGFIGPDLRMHVLVNGRDEVLRDTWEPSDGRYWENAS